MTSSLSSNPEELLPADQGVRELTLARGVAVKEYVYLEGSLANWYGFMSRSDPAKSAMAFFDLSNRARIETLQTLVKANSAGNLLVYSESLIADIEKLTLMRNAIVHGKQIAAASEVSLGSGSEKPKTWENFLLSPDHFGTVGSAKRLSSHDLVAAARRFAYCSSCVGAVSHHMMGGPLPDAQRALFDAPHVKIPTDSHPFYWSFAFHHLKAR